MEEAEKLYDAGLAHLKAGSFEEAICQFTAALAIDSKDPYYHNDLCFAYLRQGNLDGALQECQVALDLDPTHKNANINKTHILNLLTVFNTSDLLKDIEIVKNIVERPIGFQGILGTGESLALIFKDFGKRILTHSNPTEVTTVFEFSGHPITVPFLAEIQYLASKIDQDWIITASVEIPAKQPLVLFSTIADEAVKNSAKFIRIVAHQPSLVLNFRKMIFIGSNINHKIFDSNIGIIDSVTKREVGGNRGYIKFRNTNKKINFFHHLPSGKIEFSDSIEGGEIDEKPQKPWYQFWKRDRG